MEGGIEQLAVLQMPSITEEGSSPSGAQPNGFVPTTGADSLLNDRTGNMAQGKTQSASPSRKAS